MTTTDEPVAVPALAPAGPAFLAALRTVYGLVAKVYHRSEVTGMDSLPDGGALLVSNHSGGLMPMDVPVLAVAFWGTFGVERPFRVLAHDILMKGPWGDLLRSTGMIPAIRANATAALAAGAVTVVFTGGDFDAYRPTSAGSRSSDEQRLVATLAVDRTHPFITPACCGCSGPTATSGSGSRSAATASGR